MRSTLPRDRQKSRSIAAPSQAADAGNDPALLLVGHGTRSAAGTDEFWTLVRLIQRERPSRMVAGAFLELQQPTVEEVWAALAARGARHIRLVPVLLWSAGHAVRDLPEQSRALARAAPGIKVQQSPVLGFHSAILERSAQLEQAAIADMGLVDLGRTALVLVGRGSTDDEATSDMVQFGAMRAGGSTCGQVVVGFVAMATPRLGDILDQVGNDPSIRQVLVQPHLLFMGDLHCTICKMVRRSAERYPQKHWVMTGLLGPHPLIARALLDRAQET